MKKTIAGMIPFYILVFCLLIGAAVSASNTVTTMTLLSKPTGRTVIIIDAGHGKPDGGAVSCTGVEESGINLEIAQRLNDLFHLLGFQTKMIRTDQNSVCQEGNTIGQKKVSDLKKRVCIVNETENAILLSIHQNHYTESRYSGGQMFYAKTLGSKTLAEALQTAFVSYLNPGSRRQAKPCEGIYLMEHISRPGVLIECGFLSNPQEEARLRTRDYQQRICCVIAITVSNYLANT